MPDEAVLTFASEAERQAALDAIPDAPASNVENLDSWQDEQDAQVEKIEAAEITKTEGESDSSQKEPPPPPPQVPPASQEQKEPPKKEEMSDEEVVIRFKRSELPENLRAYQDGDQIVKQFSHARENINRVSDKYDASQVRISELEAQVAKVSDIQKELEDLKKASVSAQQGVDAAPPSRKKNELQAKLNGLNAAIDGLGKIEEFDAPEVAKLRDTFVNTVGVLQETVGALDASEAAFENYRKNSETKFTGLETKLDGYIQKSDKLTEKQKRDRDNETAVGALNALQGDSEFPELATTKPLYADNKDDVENGIVKFCDAVNGSPIPSNQLWETVNKFVSAFNTGNSQMANYCQQNAIFPANFGITEKDMQAYALLMNINYAKNGRRIDPSSGKVVPLKDFRGREVSFPTYKAAYKWLQDEVGLTAKKTEKDLVEAEKRGQQAVEKSLTKRDTSPEMLGADGAGDLANMGQEINEALAKELVGDTVGSRTINQEAMEVLLRAGDIRGWQMFDMLNKANKRLGEPEEQIEDDWPARPNAQQ